MVPYKGPDMLLEAATPLLQAGRMRLDMIGDGPMMESLQAQGLANGIGDAVNFHGWLDHMQVQQIAKDSTLFAFPSIREFGGGVVLEAMALGLVPLIVDYAGPAELVTEETGYKVPLGNRNEIIDCFRVKLEKLASDPSELEHLSRKARARVSTYFTWASKAQQVREVYDWVMTNGSARPEPMSEACNQLCPTPVRT
jgi:glycosyltransferase involved in cell wall biosynthesis